MKRPAFLFYPNEWRGDLELRMCSPAARGLWVDLLCLMHEGNPYGHLTSPVELILRVVGVTEKVYGALLAELEGRRIFSRTDTGLIYSRRMVKDEQDRGVRAANGKYGGRPRKASRVEVTATDAGWEEFRKLYPAHRLDEQLACQMFISRGDDAGILAGLLRAVACEDWIKQDGQFVPWASKFIGEGKYSGFKAASAAASPYVPYKAPE